LFGHNSRDGFPATGGAALADFNGNGNLDIAIPDPHSGGLMVLKGMEQERSVHIQRASCSLQAVGPMDQV